MPIVVVCTVGQLAIEKPVKVLIPMFLCKKHKDEVEVAALLTQTGRKQIEDSVKKARNKAVNWDTMTLEWKPAQHIQRIIH